MSVRVRSVVLGLFLTMTGLVVESTGPTAFASGSGGPPGSVYCGLVKTHGQRWGTYAKQVPCSMAIAWLPKMISAPERLGGGWTGPPGWFCQKVARDPGYLQRGVCGTKSGKEMAWLRVH